MRFNRLTIHFVQLILVIICIYAQQVKKQMTYIFLIISKPNKVNFEWMCVFIIYVLVLPILYWTAKETTHLSMIDTLIKSTNSNWLPIYYEWAFKSTVPPPPPQWISCIGQIAKQVSLDLYTTVPIQSGTVCTETMAFKTAKKLLTVILDEKGVSLYLSFQTRKECHD